MKTPSSSPDNLKHYTVAELSRRFSAHEVTIRRWIREGRLKPLKLGRLVRIPAEEVARFESNGAVHL